MNKLVTKKNLHKIFIMIVIIIISIFALIPINKKYEPIEWMAALSDNTKINDMTIPGTHDSGATHSIFDVSGKCQDIDIETQLNIGVRFFDIRLKLVNDEFVIVHSFVDQDLKLREILNTFNDFITTHSKEFLIISFKEDASPKNSTLDFSEALVNTFKEYDKFVFDNDLPKTLKEARGKIYILNRFSGNGVGIEASSGWKDSTSFILGSMYIQDNYSIDDIETKKQDIINTFDYALNNDKLILNFTSCYLNVPFPPTYAGTSANAINKWLKEYIDENDINGIVIIDFATEELIKKIYMENTYEENK